VEGGRAGGGTRSPSSRPAALTVVASLAPSAGRPGAPDAVGSPPSTADAGVSTPPAPPSSATPSRRSPSAGGAPPPPPAPPRRLRWQDDDGAEALAAVREFEASDDEGEGEGGGGQPVCCALQ